MTIFTTKQHQQHQSQQTAIDGRLIARIVPKEYADFERYKPTDQRLQEVDIWRERIVWPPGKSFSELLVQQQQQDDCNSSGDIIEGNNQTVTLDIQLETSIFNPETQVVDPVTATLSLQRDSAETALRTLRRIEISTQRRLEGRKPKSQRRTSSSTSLIGELSSSILVLDQQPNRGEKTGCEDRLDDDDDDLDGYRKLQIEEGMESKDLWQSLTFGPKSRLWMDVITESGITLDLDPCPPTILYVRNFEDFMADVFVGVPLVIETKVLHAERAVVVWFADDQQVSFDSFCYTPTDQDVGKKITALISPIREDRPSGCEEVYEFQNTVTTRPKLSILDHRVSWIARDSRADDHGNGQGRDPSKRLRVLSYNLMADIHLSPEVERRAKYADCDVAHLARSRRIPLLLYEILQHDADIICLQEVDATVYEQLLAPALQAHGFAGFYSNKANSQLEGCAMFWSLRTLERNSKMEVYPIRELFKESSIFDRDWDSMDNIRNFLERLPDLREVVEENVGQILQVARLYPKCSTVSDGACRDKTALVVGNTHLFYHPLADHVRLMQVFVVCKKLDDWCRVDNEEDAASTRHQLIFCGDLNSCPNSGAIKLLFDRKVCRDDEQCGAWRNLDEYTWESSDSYFDTESTADTEYGSDPALDNALAPPKCHYTPSVEPPTIEFPDSFPRLVSGYDPIPEFTNYVVGFTETLDYIFLSDAKDGPGLTVSSWAPIPAISEPAIPNEYYPSDHVSLACDFVYRSTSGRNHEH